MTNFSVTNRDPATEDFEAHLRDAIPDHIGRYMDGEPLVFHELVSDHMHLDVYIWAPTPHRRLWTLVTAGMSAHPMNVPTGHTLYERAELVITLPADWPSIETIKAMPPSQAKNYVWPINELKNLARLPYMQNTWLSIGHTVQARRSLDGTYRGADFSGMLLGALHSMPETARTLEVDNKTVHCHGLYPLYAQELRHILQRPLTGGAHDMYHRLLDAGLHEGVFPKREVLV